MNGTGDVGGLTGFNSGGTVSNCYSTGTVSSNYSYYIGGFTGQNSGSINNSFWDKETSGQLSSAGGTGLTTAQMKDSTSFTGFDFTNTWTISQNATFPWLRALASTERQGGPDISGSPNWHILGSPFTSSSFATLLDSVWTQGFTGADTTAGNPNVYTWDEATQQWTTPNSLSATLHAGQGFIVYLYTDDDPGTPGTQGGFPKILHYSGQTNNMPKTISLSYTGGGSDEVRLVLRNRAKSGMDSYDAVHLSPLSTSCVSLSSIVTGTGLAIDSRPVPQKTSVTMNLLAENVNLQSGVDTLSLVQNKAGPLRW